MDSSDYLDSVLEGGMGSEENQIIVSAYKGKHLQREEP